MAWNPKYIGLVVLSTVIDFFCGMMIHRSHNESHRKWFLAISVTTNLSLLFFFKYYIFVAENLMAAFQFLHWEVQLPTLNVILPIGISFYTFQTMCYTIDIYNRKIKPETKFFNFALYVSFFPQLIAGPIERPGKLLPQLKKKHSFNFQRIGDGLTLILWGLFLKIALADNLAPFVDSTFANMVPLNHGVPFLLAIYGFWIQLFCDFAGYSIIAIGAAKVLGINLSKNFNAPLLARNISEFWQKWHISLSTWFRDYAFMPFYLKLEKSNLLNGLGPLFRHRVFFLIAILVTDILLGFWHGAAWGFGIFGLYHAVMVTGYHYFRKPWGRLPDFLQLFFTFQIVAVSGVFFRSHTLNDIGYLFSNTLSGAWQEFAVILLSGILLWVFDRVYRLLLPLILKIRFSRVVQMASFLIWVYGLLFLALNFGGKNMDPPRQFIYFQF